jgi:hypothetical protein
MRTSISPSLKAANVFLQQRVVLISQGKTIYHYHILPSTEAKFSILVASSGSELHALNKYDP